MKLKLLVLVVLAFSACNNANKPFTDAVKEKNITEAKNLISTIYQAAEDIDSVKMTSIFLDSPDFISLINGEYANYEQTVKKYPSLMREFKTQKATILNEKYNDVDASTIVYTSKSKWECKLQNDSIAVYDNCGLQLVLKKSDNNWKVLSWTEFY
jgi:hypothetical protein